MELIHGRHSQTVSCFSLKGFIMTWLSQFSLVMRSSLTSLREKIEDPERMLHQLLIDMEEELDRVRASVAEALADEIQMRHRVEREEKDVEQWKQRATAAMQRRDESSAKSALEQKMSAQSRLDQYRLDYHKQKDAVSKLQAAVRDLEEKIRQARQKKTLLTARMARADSTRRIHSAMDRTQSQSAFAQFHRLESKVEREEAISEAWERLDGKDPQADELARQFEKEERDAELLKELEELRALSNPPSDPT